MGWRKNMGVESENEHFKPHPQKPQKPQKIEKKDKNKGFVGSVAFVAKSVKVKSLFGIDDFNPVPDPGKKVQSDMTVCPANCKKTGKCYGIAYFDTKPGKSLLCIPNQCPWADQLKQYFNRKEN